MLRRGFGRPGLADALRSRLNLRAAHLSFNFGELTAIPSPANCYNVVFVKIGGPLVAVLKALMRVFSYLYHGLLTLFLLGIAMIALSSGQPLQLGMLPWEGRPLTYWLLGIALAGLASLVLAIFRKWRPLFFLWSLAVLVVMANGFFLSHYHFGSPAEFRSVLYLFAGAIIAVFGAWFQMRRTALR